MRLQLGISMIVPVIYANLALISLPFMITQLLVAYHGMESGLSALQVAFLFCNAPVVLSFLGSYFKYKAEDYYICDLVCLSSTVMAFTTAFLSCVPLSGDFGIYLIWMALLTLISVCSFFSHLASVALISRHGARTGNPPLPGILTVDLTHALSAVFGVGVMWLGSNQCFTLLCTAALVSLPPAILWIGCSNDELIPCTDPDCTSIEKAVAACDTTNVKEYFIDERLKNDLSKDYPYLLMENSNFGKNLIDTDAQVIVIANLIYVVLVAVCHGLHCFFLVGLGQRSDELTIERCGLIYSAGVVLSSAVCIVIRPIISNDAICYKVCCILLITCGTIASLFFLSETDNYLGKYILSYCTIISACQLMEDFIEVAITRYYDSINLPAFKSFSVQDYINSKVGFLHGIGAAAGSLIFGLLVNDMDIETAIFTVTAIFTTLAVVTAPLSTLFIAAELR